jgi:hypothetical protein
MKLTWHKTEAVCRRCAIVGDADLREPAVKLAAVTQEPIAATGILFAIFGAQ